MPYLTDHQLQCSECKTALNGGLIVCRYVVKLPSVMRVEKQPICMAGGGLILHEVQEEALKGSLE